MPTSEELLDAANQAIEALQNAQETVIAAKEEFETLPCIANTAKDTADTAMAKAEETAAAVSELGQQVEDATEAVAEAKSVADAAMEKAEETADNAYPKTGGKLTGPILMECNTPHMWQTELDYDHTTYPASYAARAAYTFHGKDTDGADRELGGLIHLRGDSADNMILSFSPKKRADGTSKTAAYLQGVNPYDDDQDPYWAVSSKPPVEDYSGKIVNTGYLKENCAFIRGYTLFHVGGDNASDTDDLYNGRGLTADKPFATLDAAIGFVESHYRINSQVSYILHTDQVVNGRWFFSPHFWTTISSGESGVRRTITLGPNFDLYCVLTGLSFGNIDFEAAADRPNSLLAIRGYYNPVNVSFSGCIFAGKSTMSTGILDVQGPGAHITLQGTGTTFTGPAGRAIYAGLGASVIALGNPTLTFNGAYSKSVIGSVTDGIVNLACGLTGSATGKRFEVSNRSYLFTNRGANAIPGNTAGTVDESSYYA